MIITQPKEVIGAFVNIRQGFAPETSWGHYTALGLVRNNTLVAGVIYNNAANANIMMHIGAVEGKRWATPEFLHAVFDYPFNELGKRRVTAVVRAKNTAAQKFVENLGFVHEGAMREFFEDDDMMLYGLLRRECKYHLKKAA